MERDSQPGELLAAFLACFAGAVVCEWASGQQFSSNTLLSTLALGFLGALVCGKVRSVTREAWATRFGRSKAPVTRVAEPSYLWTELTEEGRVDSDGPATRRRL
jgi:hypothetical protein